MNQDMWINQWGCGRNKLFFSHRESNARGVIIAVSESLDIKATSVFKDNNGRFIILYAYIQDKPFLLVNYYVHNDEGGQVQTLSEINSIIDKSGIEINTSIFFFFGGGEDFNLYFDTFLDANGRNPMLKMSSLSRLISMMKENELSDIFLIRYPESRQSTWRCKNPLKQKRLDYLLISDSLQHEVETINIIPSIQSDHSVLKMKFSSLQERERDPSYWKFNNSRLHDNTFVTKMKQNPEFYNESAELNDIMSRWGFLKYRIRQFSSEFSKQKAVEREASRLYLEKRLRA